MTQYSYTLKPANQGALCWLAGSEVRAMLCACSVHKVTAKKGCYRKDLGIVALSHTCTAQDCGSGHLNSICLVQRNLQSPSAKPGICQVVAQAMVSDKKGNSATSVAT